MRKIAIALWLASPAVLAPDARGQDVEFPDGVDRVAVPMLRHCTGNGWGLPLVEVLIEGQKELFLLDTGDATVTVDDELCKELELRQIGATAAVGIGGTTRIGIYRGERLEVGGVVLWECRYTSGDMSFLGTYDGRRIRGAVGLPLLSQVVCTFDYGRGELVLHELGAFEPPANATVVPVVQSASGLACKGRLADGRLRRFPIDTGMEGALCLHAAVLEDLGITTGEASGRPRMPYAGHGDDLEWNEIARLGALELGGRTFRDVPVSLGLPQDGFGLGANGFEAGMLGSGFLVAFRSTLDPRARKLYLEGGNAAPRWTYECGLFLEPREDGIWISTFMEGIEVCAPTFEDELRLVAVDGAAPPATPALLFDLLCAQPERELVAMRGDERVVLAYSRPWPLPAVATATAGSGR